MEHYVTLFDSLFLPQGLALHKSMERCLKNYVLWVLCVDDLAFDLLNNLSLPNIKLLKLSELETNELKKVKLKRTKGEYCWTLTPFAPGFVFEADASILRVTYIDADLWFRKSPTPIFDEFVESNAAVMITDHYYALEYDQSERSGQYCVQFMIFNRYGSEPIRKWWEDRCIEWCHNYVEDGKFGDQKYLDDWPIRFGAAIHVLKGKQWILAPWNGARFPFGQSIIYHFHDTRILKNNKVICAPNYTLYPNLIEAIYHPYCDDLNSAVQSLKICGFDVGPQASNANISYWFKTLLILPYRYIKANIYQRQIRL